MKNLTLIDGDTIIYIATYIKEGENKTISEMFDICNQIVDNIMYCTNSSYYCGFLSTSKTYKHYITKNIEYKGNRVNIQKPLYFYTVRSYLKEVLKFKTIEGFEADDLCSFLSKEYKTLGWNTTISTPDKDLKQIGGLFYDYKKKEEYFIDDSLAKFNLWKQVLTGDVSDNIPGIKGIGEVKASLILSNAEIDNYHKIVFNKYIETYGIHDGITKFYENYSLIKLLEEIPNDLDIDFNNFITKYNKNILEDLNIEIDV